jgi:hypothetical protein
MKRVLASWFVHSATQVTLVTWLPDTFFWACVCVCVCIYIYIYIYCSVFTLFNCELYEIYRSYVALICWYLTLVLSDCSTVVICTTDDDANKGIKTYLS